MEKQVSKNLMTAEAVWQVLKTGRDCLVISKHPENLLQALKEYSSNIEIVPVYNTRKGEYKPEMGLGLILKREPKIAGYKFILKETDESK